jgi:multiple sugar transport system permease protein
MAALVVNFLCPIIWTTVGSVSPSPGSDQVDGCHSWGVLWRVIVHATQAAVVVLTLPCILLFLVRQRHYVRGFMSGALKGSP